MPSHFGESLTVAIKYGIAVKDGRVGRTDGYKFGWNHGIMPLAGEWRGVTSPLIAGLAWIIHDFAGGKRKGALKDG
jgi:hypothetical protein